VVELTFRTVVGSPWEGAAILQFNGESSQPVAVREGLTAKQRDVIRWPIEEVMSDPKGGNVSGALDIESGLAKYGREVRSRSTVAKYGREVRSRSTVATQIDS